jgi:hypothetical protein
MDDVMGLSAGSLPKARRAAGLRARCGDAGVLELVRYIGCLPFALGLAPAHVLSSTARSGRVPSRDQACCAAAAAAPVQDKCRATLTECSSLQDGASRHEGDPARPAEQHREEGRVVPKQNTLETVDYKDLLAIHLLTQLAGSAPRAPRRGARRCRTRRRPC